MSVCSELLNIFDEAFTMKCELCDQQLKEERMISCTECMKYLCSDCINNWAYQQLTTDIVPSCPFCRTDLPMMHLYEQTINRPQTDMLDKMLSSNTFLATTPEVWDLPPVSWYAYFAMLGWTLPSPPPPPTSQEIFFGLLNEYPDPYENISWLDWTPGLIDELTTSDDEFLQSRDWADRASWTGRLRREARRETRRNRRSQRTPRRVRRTLDLISLNL